MWGSTVASASACCWSCWRAGQQFLGLAGVVRGLAHGGADLGGGDAVAVDRIDAIGCPFGGGTLGRCRRLRAFLQPQRLGDGVVAVWLSVGVAGAAGLDSAGAVSCPGGPAGAGEGLRRAVGCPCPCASRAASWRRLASRRPASERLMLSWLAGAGALTTFWFVAGAGVAGWAAAGAAGAAGADGLLSLMVHPHSNRLPSVSRWFCSSAVSRRERISVAR